jgi:putative transcriptional regulator
MNSLKGHLLVATTELLDPNFVRTVVLLFDHTKEGAAGVVLNRPTETTVSDISEQLFEERVEWESFLYLGGPVPGPLMVLHQVEDLADRPLLEGVYSTLDSTKIRAIVERRPEPCLFIAQYAGWGVEQLEAEIAEGSWYVVPATVDHVFQPNSQVGELWDVTIKEVRAAALAAMVRLKEVPPDPNLN